MVALPVACWAPNTSVSGVEAVQPEPCKSPGDMSSAGPSSPGGQNPPQVPSIFRPLETLLQMQACASRNGGCGPPNASPNRPFASREVAKPDRIRRDDVYRVVEVDVRAADPIDRILVVGDGSV